MPWCTHEGENSFIYVCGFEHVTVHTWGWEFTYIHVWLWACHGAHVRARRQLWKLVLSLHYVASRVNSAVRFVNRCLYLPSTSPTPAEELLDMIPVFSFYPLFLVASCFLRWCLIFGHEFMLWGTLLWRLQKAPLVCADAFPDCVCVAPARQWEHGLSNPWTQTSLVLLLPCAPRRPGDRAVARLLTGLCFNFCLKSTQKHSMCRAVWL